MGTGNFADLNECVETENICGTNSICDNTDGSYTCNCESGYEKFDGSCLGEINMSGFAQEMLFKLSLLIKLWTAV